MRIRPRFSGKYHLRIDFPGRPIFIQLPPEGDTVAVFMMATYGEGDPTDNAQEFFDWLKDGGADLKGA